MICAHCGTTLPRSALFCGECGRAVASESPRSWEQPIEPPPAPPGAVPDPPTPVRGRTPASKPVAPVPPAPPAAPAADSRDAADVAQAPRRRPGRTQWAEDPVTGDPIAADPNTVAPITGDPITTAEPPSGSDVAEATDAGASTVAAPAEPARKPAAPAPGNAPEAAAQTAGPERCEQCGTMLAADDIFCGECGFVSRSVRDAFTRAIPVQQPAQQPVQQPVQQSVQQSVQQPDAAAAPGDIRDTSVGDTDTGGTNTKADTGGDDVDATTAPPAHTAVTPPAAEPPAALAPLAAPAEPADAVRAQRRDDLDDVEATRIVARGGTRYMLQFSTGESVNVRGSGLIGRNPKPEPNEHVDQLVRIFDTGKSVSKTHLEFGQEAGQLWVQDRFSGNGTVIREPDSPPRQALPGRRYRIARGSRVEIGEQFFTVN